MTYAPPPKPAEVAETRLITAILDGQYPIAANIPGERELAAQLGVTRPTLREALQRLARDGWIEIRHGKPTRVCDYWQEGNLGVLATLAKHPAHLPADFIPNLLAVRALLAPAYTRLAIERNPQAIQAVLKNNLALPDTAEAYAAADWQLHHQLAVASANPIFTLILNGFHGLYPVMGHAYFSQPEARAHSLTFYRALLTCAQTRDPAAAQTLTHQTMAASAEMWPGE